MADDKKHPRKDGDYDDDGAPESEGKRGVGDAIKKLFAVGTAAAFLSEEAIRQTLGDLKLPKEMLNLVLSGANKSKEELMNRVGSELVKLVSKLDIVKEASKFMETHKFRVNAEIEIIKKEEKPD